MTTSSGRVASGPSYANQGATVNNYNTGFTSPTDSDFSIGPDDFDDVRDWDATAVADWLKGINAGQYIDLFHAHDITGENLMDLDQSMLKEMGVKKIGDRVRIGAQAKLFRYNEYRRKRESSRVSVTTPSVQNDY